MRERQSVCGLADRGFLDFVGHGRLRLRVMDVTSHMFVVPRFEGLTRVFDPGRLPE